MKCAAAWSGGKDSCFACFKAMRQGHTVKYLLNIVEEGGDYAESHPINAAIVKKQAQAIGIPLIQRRVISQRVNRREFEKQAEKAIYEIYKKGIRGLVVGYTHEDYQRLLVKRILSKYNMRLIENLFGLDSRRTLIEMVNAGLKAVIVEVSADIISKDWLGRSVDKEFIQYLTRLGGVDFCGDYGEYHSVILDGSIFKKRIEIRDYEITRQKNRILMRIKECGFLDKEEVKGPVLKRARR